MQGREDAKYLRRETKASIGGGERGGGSRGGEGVTAIACGVVSVAIGVREVWRRLRLGGSRTWLREGMRGRMFELTRPYIGSWESVGAEESSGKLRWE